MSDYIWIGQNKNMDDKNIESYKEDSHSWNEAKDNIKSLKLETANGWTFELPDDMEEYIQGKTASADLGSGQIEIESRFIGFKLGNNTIKLRINDKIKVISVEVE